MTFIKLPTFPSRFPTHQAVCQAHTSPAPLTPCPSRKELVTLHPVLKEKAKTLAEEIQTLPFLSSDTSVDGKGHYLWGFGYNPLRDLDATVEASSTLPVLHPERPDRLIGTLHPSDLFCL